VNFVVPPKKDGHEDNATYDVGKHEREIGRQPKEVVGEAMFEHAPAEVHEHV